MQRVYIYLILSFVFILYTNAKLTSKRPKNIDFLPDNEPSEADREYLQRYKKNLYNLEDFSSNKHHHLLENSIEHDKDDMKRNTKINNENNILLRSKKSIFGMQNFDNTESNQKNIMMPCEKFILNAGTFGKLPVHEIQQNDDILSESHRIRKSINNAEVFVPPLPLSPIPHYQAEGFPWCNEYKDCDKQDKIGFIPQYPDPCPVLKEYGPSYQYQQQLLQQAQQQQLLQYQKIYTNPNVYPNYGGIASSSKPCGC